MKKLIAAAAFGLLGLAGTSAAAETCGGTYVVQGGDSLSLIADGMYKDVGKWTAIHGANSSVIGTNPANLRVGMRLNLPCIGGFPKGLADGQVVEAEAAAPAPVVEIVGTAATRQKVNLLTGDDYAPFTDRGLHNGGLTNDIVQQAMEFANPDAGFAIHWVNGWSGHLDPLLSNALLDMGFPWGRPDCETDPDAYRCTDFEFSEPLFEMLMLFFTAADSDMVFNTDADVLGRTICRPEGYSQFFFDHEGRNWLKDGKITLVTPPTLDNCFEMLLEGEVDAVAMNEFTGRATIKKFGTDKFKVLPRPASLDGLHVVIHKSHPQVDEMLALINEGLVGIKENGTYQAIIEDHLARIWADF